MFSPFNYPLFLLFPLLSLTPTLNAALLSFNFNSKGFHFPDCRDVGHIRRVFNLFEMVILEEFLPPDDKKPAYTAYYSYDVHLLTFIKADWLLSVISQYRAEAAEKINFRGILWDSSTSSTSSFSTSTFKLLFYGPKDSWKMLPVIYNADRQLFHVIEKNKLEDLSPQVPSLSEVSGSDGVSTWAYQTSADSLFAFNEVTLLFKEGSSKPKVLPTPLFGVFNASSIKIGNEDDEDKKTVKGNRLYKYYSSKRIEEVGNSSSEVYDFSEVLPCHLVLDTDWILAGAVVAQVALVVLLIFLNMRLSNKWISRGGGRLSDGSFFSERIDSRFNNGGRRRNGPGGTRTSSKSNTTDTSKLPAKKGRPQPPVKQKQAKPKIEEIQVKQKKEKQAPPKVTPAPPKQKKLNVKDKVKKTTTANTTTTTSTTNSETPTPPVGTPINSLAECIKK